jgi:chromosome segregation ATPase
MSEPLEKAVWQATSDPKDARIAELEASLAAANRHAFAVEEERDIAIGRYQRAEGEAQGLKAIIKTAEKDRDLWCMQASAKDARIAEVAAQLENSLGREQNLFAKYQQDRAALEAARAEIEALRKQLEEAWEARDQYLHSNVKLKDEILALRKRVGELERDNGDLEAEKDRVSTENGGLCMDLNAAIARAEQAEAQLDEAKATALKYWNAAVEAEAQLAEIRKTHGVAMGVNEDLKDDLRAQLAKSEKANAANIAYAKDLGAQLASRQIDIDTFRAGNQQLRAQLAVAREALDALRERQKLFEDGSRPVAYHRDTLGRYVREAWIRWARIQPNPKPSWLVEYDDLPEPDKEADRQIGECIARWTLIGDAARAALQQTAPASSPWDVGDKPITSRTKFEGVVGKEGPLDRITGEE